MGIARGRAKVRFGGNKGQEIELTPGDVCVLPAGTGHQCLWASPDLMVIGAYPQDRQIRPLPRQQGASTPRRCRPSRKCRCPTSDPVFGKQGPLLRLWRSLSAPDARMASASDWIAFWDGKHSIYVNARHEAAHFRRIAEDIRALCAATAACMLDYGCGEALSADRVAEPAGAADPVRGGAERARQARRALCRQRQDRGAQPEDVAPAGAVARSRSSCIRSRNISSPRNSTRCWSCSTGC